MLPFEIGLVTIKIVFIPAIGIETLIELSTKEKQLY
jgi:hypothetical protein